MQSDISETTGTNAALFCSPAETEFLTQSLSPWLHLRDCYLMTGGDELLPEITGAQRLAFSGDMLDAVDAPSDQLRADIEAALSDVTDLSCLIVDMSWALNAIWGASIVERWGGIAHQFAMDHGVTLVSLYDRETVVEDQIAAAFRAHQAFLSPSGLYENPHWLPRELVVNATLEGQLGFLLGRVVPEFANQGFRKTPLPDAARGATPSWIRRSRHTVASEAANSRWHIHCLGQLRVFVDGSQPVDWALPGSAPKKSRALFAYLLNRSDSWCHADQLSEFLWPDTMSETGKRARLRHTIAMLRKTLGGTDSVKRSGEYYQLNTPEGSWIDIRSFEQLCRRGLALFRHKDYAAAIRVYEAADRLYTGDLFEDLPLEYVESEFDDWCMPKRVWLRGMAVKLQYDMSKVLRHQNRLREALDRAQKAVRLDPVDDNANIEVMRNLAAQGRQEAITRQFTQFQKAVMEFDGGEPSDEVQNVYRELMATDQLAGPKQKPNAAI